ncbi:MAG: SusC/RagA family TonB-linked outer membrane protein [Bacteroidota bacterium]
MKLSCYSKNIGIWMFVLLSIWLPQRAFAADALSLEQERMLVDVLEEMGERYQVFFNYESDLLKEVTVHFEFRQTEALQDAVQRLLQNTGLKYERFGEKYIVIYRDDRQGRRTARKIEKRIDQISRLEGKGGLSISRSLNDPLQTNLNIAVQAQSLQQTISGVVRNGDGEALAGATVRGKGTNVGVLTDGEGKYSISLADDVEYLLISYIGFESQEVAINGRSNIDVTMVVEESYADEVVVVGYGSQKRSDLTGAVASIDADVYKDVPLQSFEQGIQGRLAGVLVTQTTGAPGAPISVQIRGVGTTGDTEPLYVIDGYPVSVGQQGSLGSSPLNTLNPNDIEAIEVLKDASATAIYGSRGANGVIIITTKRGSQGDVRVDYNGYIGTQSVWKRLDLLGEEDYRTYLIDAYAARGVTPDSADFPSAYATGVPGNNTNWQDEMFQSGIITDHNVTVGGGTEKARFSLGVGYLLNEGTLRNTDFQRTSVKLNSDFKIGKRIRIGESVQLGFTQQNREKNVEGRREFEHIIKNTAGVPLLDPTLEGGFGQAQNPDGHDAPNPVAISENTIIRPQRYRMLGSIYGEIDILKGLTYRINLGMDLFVSRNFSYNPTYANVRGQTVRSSLSEGYNLSVNPLIEHTLTYNVNFGASDLTLLVGATDQSFNFRTVNTQVQDLPNNEILAVINGTGFSQTIQTRLRSQLGRLIYNFDDRYLLTATVRRDGSSKLNPENRFDIFPSASIGWRISNEAFMANVAAVSDLKLRASWGQIGNEKTLGAYPTVASLNSAALYNFGGTEVPGVALSFLPNPNIRWEIAQQIDFGIDLGLFDNRILFTADYFDRETRDLIVPVPVPQSLGFSNVAPVNAGTIRNTGVELALTYRKLTGEFQYNISGNVTFLENEVISLGDNGQPIFGGSAFTLGNLTKTEEGQPVGAFFGFVTDGIFQSQAEVDAHATQTPETSAGDIRFRDISGPEGIPDGIINDDDRVFIGNPNPDLIYGATLSANYKGFDLSLNLQGVSGNEIYNALGLWLEGMNQNFNYSTVVNDRWTPSNTDTDVPRAIIGDPNANTRNSDRYIEDGSFMRIKNFTIGYTIPTGTGGLSYLRNARFYVSSQNLLTVTNYSGFDPEIGGLGSNISRGIDIGTYPQPRSFLLGAQLSF